ncbi:Major cardiolipin synthase ClsA [bacterium HR33]|nr:Major cardiolipin synthase ClsA [bacterium HR33]
MTEIAEAQAFRPGTGTDLGRALDRACGGRAIPGNRVSHLVDGPLTFEAMLRLIGEARHYVHFENYIIRDDRTGKRFAAELKEAARRGVQVRVLYDALGCRSTSRRFWDDLRRAGIEVHPFNPVNPLHPIASLRRNHRKYVGADGYRAIVGGLCIGDEWSGDPARGRMPWRDTAVEVCGPAARAIDLTFQKLWRKSGGETATVLQASPPAQCGEAVVRVVEGVPGRLKVYRAVELLVASASHRLWITDAYLVAPAPLFAGLLAAARDGVDVRLLLPGRTDIPAVRAFTRVGYRELLEAGVRIWEWRGPMLHAKTAVVDDVWFKVGSSNLNLPSFLSNYELDLLLEDPKLAAEAAFQFRRDLAFATEIVLRPRRVFAPLAERLPPAVVAGGAPPEIPAHRPWARELSQRAVLTLRQVAGGARRSIAGALLFVSAGVGALFLAAPRFMGYLVAFALLWIGVGAARQFAARRHQGDE